MAYTGQADLKANLVITTSSLVLTIVATRWSEQSLRPGLSALAVGALCALFTAITVVIPKFRFHGKGEARDGFEAHDQGRYLVEKKYRHLRMAYMFLGLAFLAGAIAQSIATFV